MFRPFTASKAHLRVCLLVACRAAGEGRRHQLAQVYDEVCRKEWSAKAARGMLILNVCTCSLDVALVSPGDADFDSSCAGVKLDAELLVQARESYDVQFKPKPEKRAVRAKLPSRAASQSQGSSFPKNNKGKWDSSQGQRWKTPKQQQWKKWK